MKALKILIGVGFLLVSNLLLAQRSNPVAYQIHVPKTVSLGEEFTVTVDFQTKNDWYIYAPTGKNEAKGMIETKIKFSLPKGITAIGKLKIPTPRPKGMYQIYQGNSIRFSQKFKATQKGAQTIDIIVTYQTCNKQMCLPPKTTTHQQKLICK